MNKIFICVLAFLIAMAVGTIDIWVGEIIKWVKRKIDLRKMRKEANA